MLTPVAFWIILGVVLMVIEIFTPSFFIFWFGLGSLAAAVVAYVWPNTLAELLTFIVVSGVLVLSTRRLAKRITGEQARSINVDEIIGKSALVIEKISNRAGTGLVKINGDMWRAMTQDDSTEFEKGIRVKVLKVEGAHVVVGPLEPVEGESTEKRESAED